MITYINVRSLILLTSPAQWMQNDEAMTFLLHTLAQLHIAPKTPKPHIILSLNIIKYFCVILYNFFYYETPSSTLLKAPFLIIRPTSPIPSLSYPHYNILSTILITISQQLKKKASLNTSKSWRVIDWRKRKTY